MPTILPRLSVVVTPEQHHLLTSLAALQGRSASSYVRRLVEVATPSLRALLASLEGVEAQEVALDENAQAAIEQLLDEAEDELADQLDMLDVFDTDAGAENEGLPSAALAVPEAPPEASQPPYSNTGVRSPQTVVKPAFQAIAGGRRDAR